MTLWKITHVHCLSSFLICCYVSAETSCPLGLFGSRCNQKCRCVDNKCETNGQCIDPFTCLGGWFGPECQYADIAYQTTNNPVLTDGDDSTCLLPTAPDTVTIQLNESVVFTWLRVYVQDKGSADIKELLLTFHLNTSDVTCTDLKKVPVDNTTLDMHCNLNQTINKLTLEGAAVTSLCSVYVSGECSPGQFGKGCNQTCSSNCAVADNTTVTSCDYFTGVCLVGCKPGFTGELCDTEVSPEMIGNNGSLMCSKHCEPSRDANTPSCNKATGVCTGGCKNGFTGASCNSVCEPGSFGKDCGSKCVDNCPASGGANDSMCDPVTGVCLRGCTIGPNGVYCRSAASETPSGGSGLELIIGVCSIFAATFALTFFLRKKKRSRPYAEMTAYSPARPN